MIYSEEKSAGLAFPLIAILLAIVGILAVLVATGGRHGSAAGRVWVPQDEQQGPGQRKASHPLPLAS
ncbi:hypothetical protein B5K05_23710 [Rhizobium phaseoli]|uniref:hypothetical protein n=1 Tax=Rhizobium phaseoli TaxID=396 RepID=UPI00062D12F1|nr:hypothetical protein [Rhizobium phaseoli]KKZ84129.1 hypothetical protein RPHASCH2410_PD04290 [Rhizobium phaseoli Ch24-10]RDJ04693.1 hypothetical protein B5K04_23645 [Rhizobium phaseoli]RDJ06946.1 hypothetical protein B5K05_23710 [Rhizobium phaseoli]